MDLDFHVSLLKDINTDAQSIACIQTLSCRPAQLHVVIACAVPMSSAGLRKSYRRCRPCYLTILSAVTDIIDSTYPCAGINTILPAVVAGQSHIKLYPR